MNHPKLFKTAKSAHYPNGDKAIKIQSPFDWELIKKIKTIPDRKYHKEKYWNCPLSLLIVLHTLFEIVENNNIGI